MNIIKKITSIVIIACLISTSFSFQTVNVFAGASGNNLAVNTDIIQNIDQEFRAFGETDTAPVLDKALINGTILTLSFDKALDAEKIPSLNVLFVKISDDNAGDAGNIFSEDSIDTISVDTGYIASSVTADIVEIDVYDNKAILILGNSVTPSDVVVVDYNPSGDIDQLCDQSGNAVEAFSDYEVTNITGGTGLPDFVVEAVYNELDISSLSEELARQIYYAMLDYQESKEVLMTTSSYICSILQSADTYSGLTDESKLEICNFFGISDAFFAYSVRKGESIEQAILIYSKMISYGFTEEEIEQTIQNNTRDTVISEKEQESLDQVNGTGMLRATAMTTDANPFTDVKYDKEKMLGAPFQHTSAANEQINLSSGTLDYNVTDAVLPGAGGLDLVLERQYSTEQANYYDVISKLQYRTSSTGSAKDSRMNVYERERYFAKNADGTMGDQTNTTSYKIILDDLMYSKSFMGYYNMKQIEDEGNRYSAYLYKKTMTTSQTYMSAKQMTNPLTLNEKMWQLGAGWSFNFSYIDIDDFYYDYMKLHLSDGREFGVSTNWVNNLGHYTYKDVIFATGTNTVAGQSSSYNVTYADGKIEYFNSGGRLIAIVDRFGNTISFTYTTVNNMLVVTITDTLGRVITLTNTATSTGYNKILTLPDGQTITYAINHNTARTLNAFDQYESFPGQNNEYNLSKVINQEGEETSYTYTDTLCGTDFAARYKLTATKLFMSGDTFDDGDKYYPNYYAGLTKITYPTGLAVNYEYYRRYNNWYDYGVFEDIAIKKRYDQQGTVIYNQKEYDYSYRYKKNGVLTEFLYNADGYHNELSESDPFDDWMDWWVLEKDTGRNITKKYYFDAFRGFCVQEKTYLGLNLIQSNSTEYRTYNRIVHPSKTRVTTSRYDTSDGQPWTTTECYDYNNRGNAIAYWPTLSEGNTSDTEYKVSMSYHDIYNYLTGKTYKRDAATTISEQNVPSGDGKTVAQSLVHENGTLKSKSEFVYDNYGNVTEGKEYTDLSTDSYTETDYTYMDGTYLTGITVLNIIDADGVNIGNVGRQATYDIYGRILTETDGKGIVTTYAYDDIGRIIQVTYPGSITKTYVYNTASNQTTVTDERGFVTRYQYDKAGNLTAIYSVYGGTATLLRANEYDNLFRLTKEQNNLSEGGGATTYSYDHKDRIIQNSSKNSTGQTLSQENYAYYDDKTTKTVAGDGNSAAIVTTEYTDKYGRVTKQGRFVNGTEIFNIFAYNYLGEVVKEKSARANAESFTEDFTTKYEYDFAGNVAKQYDVFGNYITTAYDAAGRKISVTDAKNNAAGGTYSTVYNYDALSRLIKEVTPFTVGSTAVTKYYYDANGNLAQKQVANNLPEAAESYTKVEYVYNNRDQLVKVKSYDGSTVANQVDYEYDAAGNMTAMVTGNGTQRTEYEYDRNGNLTRLTDPLGQEETYTYDINGNMTTKTDKNGLTTNYTYDGLARKLSQSITSEGALQLETMAYTSTGTLAYIENENLRTDYTYDELGRVITEVDSKGVEKDYTYDVKGNLKTSVVKVNDTLVKTTSFVYDKKDRLAEVYEAGDLVASYTYDANGNRNSLTYGNGTGTDYDYNLANLVTSLENMKGSSTLSSYAYTYYLDGNQATKADYTGRQTSYSYDGLGRLTQEAESSAADAVTKAYTFDPAGNRASMTVSGAESYTANYDYDLNNRLTDETRVTGSVTEVTDYFYDNNGNTIAKRTGTLTASSGSEIPELSFDMTGAELYKYDGFGRMTGVQNASGSSIFTYKPEGLRFSKTVDGVTTTHVWEGNQIILEIDEDDAVTNRFIRGIGLIKSDDNGWYLFNGHGDVVQLTDSTGTVTKAYTYDAFGNEKDIDSDDTNPFRYSGEYNDLSSGTYYLRARDYNPTTGRFLTEDTHWNPNNMIYGDYPVKTNGRFDPLGLNTYTYTPDFNAISQSTNLYVYCGNNPVMYIDQDGHIFMVVTGAVGAVVGGVAGGIYSYNKYGQVRWQNVVGGAAIGGAIGLTGGAAAGVLVAGSATASTLAVGTGFSSLAVAMNTGGLAAGGAFLTKNVQNAAVQYTVLGSNPGYLQLADKLKARVFDVPSQVWSKLTSTQKWALNQEFLNKSMAKGHEFIFSTNAYTAKEGSYLYSEIQYLLNNGYRIVDEGWRMIK